MNGSVIPLPFLKSEIIGFSETLVTTYRTTRRHVQKTVIFIFMVLKPQSSHNLLAIRILFIVRYSKRKYTISGSGSAPTSPDVYLLSYIFYSELIWVTGNPLSVFIFLSLLLSPFHFRRFLQLLIYIVLYCSFSFS